MFIVVSSAHRLGRNEGSGRSAVSTVPHGIALVGATEGSADAGFPVNGASTEISSTRRIGLQIARVAKGEIHRDGNSE